MASFKAFVCGLLFVVFFNVMLSSWLSGAADAPLPPPEIAPIPAPPTVLKQFFDPNFTFSMGQSGLPDGVPGNMWYDEAYPGYKNSLASELFPGVWQNLTFLQTSSFYFELDGVCRDFGANQSFSSFWSWLPVATYVGQVTIGGRVTDEWVLYHDGYPLIFNADHANNSIPVRFIVPAPSIVSTTLSNFTFLWSEELVPGPIPDADSIFNVPDSCLGSGSVCPVEAGSKPVETFDWYLFHDPSNFSLVNVNVADDLGDAYFVCGASLSGAFGYFQWLSWWEVSANTSWGQYEFCNFGSCLGGSHNLVGREAAEGLGAQGGQCASGNGTTNNIVGNWFSLPQGGFCAEGAEVGTDGCSWQIVGRMKTINGTCLINDQFTSTCISSFETGDFEPARQLFLQAFASDDPANGGCPPLPGPEFTSEVSLRDAATSVSSSPSFSLAPSTSTSRNFELINALTSLSNFLSNF